MFVEHKKVMSQAKGSKVYSETVFVSREFKWIFECKG